MTPKRVALAKHLPVDQAAPFTPLIVAAMKAFQLGKATEHQQRELCTWLLQEAGGIGQQSFRAGDPQATAFMDGRRFVAIQMMMLLQQKETRDG